MVSLGEEGLETQISDITKRPERELGGGEEEAAWDGARVE